MAAHGLGSLNRQPFEDDLMSDPMTKLWADDYIKTM